MGFFRGLKEFLASGSEVVRRERHEKELEQMRLAAAESRQMHTEEAARALEEFQQSQMGARELALARAQGDQRIRTDEADFNLREPARQRDLQGKNLLDFASTSRVVPPELYQAIADQIGVDPEVLQQAYPGGKEETGLRSQMLNAQANMANARANQANSGGGGGRSKYNDALLGALGREEAEQMQHPFRFENYQGDLDKRIAAERAMAGLAPGMRLPETVAAKIYGGAAESWFQQMEQGNQYPQLQPSGEFGMVAPDVDPRLIQEVVTARPDLAGELLALVEQGRISLPQGAVEYLMSVGKVEGLRSDDPVIRELITRARDLEAQKAKRLSGGR
jgi:hypothetical protein